jgi:uncharacterized membrane protein YcjF (UPF0283 family)
MTAETVVAVMVAAIWGGLWAAFLQFNYHGRFLAARMTWLCVVIGVGVDLLILACVLDFYAWLVVCAVVAASAVAIIIRSLVNESQDWRRYVRLKNEQRSQSQDTETDSGQD